MGIEIGRVYVSKNGKVVVVEMNGHYVIDDGEELYCTCADFIYRGDREGRGCKHIELYVLLGMMYCRDKLSELGVCKNSGKEWRW